MTELQLNFYLPGLVIIWIAIKLANTRWNLRPRWVLLAVAIVFASHEGASGQIMSYDTNIEFYRINENNEALINSVRRLTVSFDRKNNQWRLDNISKDSHTAFQKDLILQRSVVGPKDKKADFVKVSSDLDGYPIDVDWAERLAWFAFCAKNFLANKDGQPVIVPSADTRWDFYVHCCRAKIHWRSEQDSCPEEVQFLFDKELFKKSIDQLNVQAQGNALNSRAELYKNFESEYTNGTLVAVFKVNDWKAVAGYGVPNSWGLEIFWFGRLSFRCLATTLNATVVDQIEPLAISMNAEVADFRVRDASHGINFVSYRITNGVIPSINDPVVRGKINKVIGYDKTTLPIDMRKKRMFMFIIIAILGLLPLLLILIRRMRSNK